MTMWQNDNAYMRDPSGTVFLATWFLIVGTDVSYWGDVLQITRTLATKNSSLWVTKADSTRQCILRTPGLNDTITTNVVRMTRGLTLLNENPNEPTGYDDVAMALEELERVFTSKATTATQKIICFQIMTAAFVLLRPGQASITSVVTQLKLLLEDSVVRDALQSLGKSLQVSHGKSPGQTVAPALWRETKALLDLLLSRVCAVAALGHALEALPKVQTACQTLFPPALVAALITSGGTDWDHVRVYKMTQVETWAVAALPAAALVATDLWPAAVAFLGATSLTPQRRMAVFTKLLNEFDDPPQGNFYAWRTILTNLVSTNQPILCLFPQAADDEDENQSPDRNTQYNINQADEQENQGPNRTDLPDGEHEIVFVKADSDE